MGSSRATRIADKSEAALATEKARRTPAKLRNLLYSLDATLIRGTHGRYTLETYPNGPEMNTTKCDEVVIPR
jgi:hypothetical protein